MTKKKRAAFTEGVPWAAELGASVVSWVVVAEVMTTVLVVRVDAVLVAVDEVIPVAEVLLLLWAMATAARKARRMDARWWRFIVNGYASSPAPHYNK